MTQHQPCEECRWFAAADDFCGETVGGACTKSIYHGCIGSSVDDVAWVCRVVGISYHCDDWEERKNE